MMQAEPVHARAFGDRLGVGTELRGIVLGRYRGLPQSIAAARVGSSFPVRGAAAFPRPGL